MVYYLPVRLQNYRSMPQSQWLATSPRLRNQTAYPETKIQTLTDDTGSTDLFGTHEALRNHLLMNFKPLKQPLHKPLHTFSDVKQLYQFFSVTHYIVILMRDRRGSLDL
jgi:hypothetical protein